MGPRADLDVVGKRQIFLPLPGIEYRFTDHPTRSAVTTLTEQLYKNKEIFLSVLQSNIRKSLFGRAVAQAVSRWLPTAAARVRVRAACGACGGQSGTGAGFLRVLRFPLTIIPPSSPLS
jgi:hypothetical protein